MRLIQTDVNTPRKRMIFATVPFHESLLFVDPGARKPGIKIDRL